MVLKGKTQGQAQRCFLGIDAGQTHIEITLLGENGTVLARGEGGPSHVQGGSMQKVFQHSLLAAIEHSALSIGELDIAAVGIGVSGLGIPGKREAVQAVLQQVFPQALLVVDNDAVVNHFGATGGADGASILAGTGTILYGEYERRSCRLGGFGYMFGDEGGGFWIGMTAIRHALQASEGRAPATALVPIIEEHFEVDSVRKIPGLQYSRGSIDVKTIAELAIPVFQAAHAGDEIAVQIVLAASDELSQLLNALLSQLNIPGNEPFPVYRLGGIWKSGPMLNERFIQQVCNRYPNIAWLEPRYHPAAGAAWMAKAKYEGEQR